MIARIIAKARDVSPAFSAKQRDIYRIFWNLKLLVHRNQNFYIHTSLIPPRTLFHAISVSMLPENIVPSHRRKRPAAAKT